MSENAALVSRRTYIMHQGEKIDVTAGIPEELRDAYGDDLGRLPGFLVEEVWDTKHPDCPFVFAPMSKRGLAKRKAGGLS